jgi:hypothetical protein
MKQNTRVTFAMRDLDRLTCIQAVVDGDLKPGPYKQVVVWNLCLLPLSLYGNICSVQSKDDNQQVRGMPPIIATYASSVTHTISVVGSRDHISGWCQAHSHDEGRSFFLSIAHFLTVAATVRFGKSHCRPRPGRKSGGVTSPDEFPGEAWRP